jgi:protein-tyrosine phosphatase
MIPALVDTHCHLLAGLDDGPRSDDEALAMCEIAYNEGTRLVCAVAHQNERYCDVTPERIRTATVRLADQLRERGSGLTVIPCAEVMVWPDLEQAWAEGRLLSVGDTGKYLLIELPHGLFVDLTGLTRRLVAAGVRPILAHPERQPEFVDDVHLLEALVEAGCLVQVTSGSVTEPPAWLKGDRLKDWFRRGLAHLLASDGHSPRRRRPLMAAAHERIVKWVGAANAERVCGTNGNIVVQGLPLCVSPPLPALSRRWWLPWVN